MRRLLKTLFNSLIIFGLVLTSHFSTMTAPAANAQESGNTLSINRVEWRAGDDLLIVAGNGAGRTGKGGAAIRYDLKVES